MLTVKACFDLYLRKNANLADSSIAIKSRAVGGFVKFLGDIAAAEVTRDMAEAFRAWLLKDGRGEVSANIYLANLAPIFGWLNAGGYIPTNPFRDIRRYRTGRKVRPLFTKDEIERILTVAGPRWRAIVLLSARHSLRRGEALNVCREDIQGQWLHIQAKKKDKSHWPWTIKNHAEALVRISEPLAQAFAEVLIEVPEAQPYVVVEPKTYRRMMHLQAENSLEWQLRGCPYSNFTRAWRNLLKRATVPMRRYQDLRGSYSMVLKRAGLPLDEIQKLMRHSSLQTTQQHYLKYEPRELAVKSENIFCEFYKSNVR